MGNKYKNRCTNWIHGHDSLPGLYPTLSFLFTWKSDTWYSTTELKVVFEQAFMNHLHRAVVVNATSRLLTHATTHNCMTRWSPVQLNPRVFAVVAGQGKTAKKYGIADVYL